MSIELTRQSKAIIDGVGRYGCYALGHGPLRDQFPALVDGPAPFAALLLRVRTTLLRNAFSFSSLSRFSSSALPTCCARPTLRQRPGTASNDHYIHTSLSTSIFPLSVFLRPASACPRIFSSLSLVPSLSTFIFVLEPRAVSSVRLLLLSRDGLRPPLRLGGLRLRGGGLRSLSRLGLRLRLLGGGLRLGLRRRPKPPPLYGGGERLREGEREDRRRRRGGGLRESRGRRSPRVEGGGVIEGERWRRRVGGGERERDGERRGGERLRRAGDRGGGVREIDLPPRGGGERRRRGVRERERELRVLKGGVRECERRLLGGGDRGGGERGGPPPRCIEHQ